MNKLGPKVSICVQAYNNGPYIDQCLKSLVNQNTNFEFEIVLGEDDSTDNTKEICRKYANVYPTIIRLFERDKKDKIIIDGSPSGRFNYISNFNVAKGEYIMVCDGDDYWSDPFKMQKQVDFLEKNLEFSSCYCPTDKLDQKSGEIFPLEANAKKDLTFADVARIMLPLHHSSICYRKKIITEFPEWVYRTPSMDIFIFSFLSLKSKIGFVDTKPTVYRINEGSITKQKGHSGSNYSVGRLFFWTNFKQEYNLTNDYIDAVICYHMSELLYLTKINQDTFLQNSNFDIVKLLGRKMLSKQILSSLINRK